MAYATDGMSRIKDGSRRGTQAVNRIQIQSFARIVRPYCDYESFPFLLPSPRNDDSAPAFGDMANCNGNGRVTGVAE